MKKRFIQTAAGALALSVAQISMGFEAGEWLLRAGAANVDPDSSNGNIAALSNAKVEVDDDTQLGLNVAYFVTDNVAVELLAATPFKHDIDVGGAAAGDTKHLPPTLTANWYPASSDSAYQPYLGVGLNYTIFFEDQLNAATATALSATDLEIDDSFGLSAQIGLDYQISDTLFLNAQVRYIDISTDATVKTTAGNVDFDVDIDPMVYMIGLGFKL